MNSDRVTRRKKESSMGKMRRNLSVGSLDQMGCVFGNSKVILNDAN